MKIKILFNSEASQEGVSVGWGFSCLVDARVLFDTGEKAEYLAENLERMAVNLEALKAVVISHDHWDHTGGLSEILKRRPGVKVYVCPCFGRSIKVQVNDSRGVLIENADFAEVEKNIYVTGEAFGMYKGKQLAEQALIIDSGRKLTMITGCAHPGIIKMIEAVMKRFPEKPIDTVFGGFHLKGEGTRDIEAVVARFVGLGIKRVGPTHCTGAEAVRAFRDVYQEHCYALRVGDEVEV